MSNFKKSKSENERITELSKIIERYPDEFPLLLKSLKNVKLKISIKINFSF